MDFGFTTARNVVGDARELSVALMEALDELQAAGAGRPASRVKAAASSRAGKPAAKKRLGAMRSAA
jgi:hypothetical protein